MQFYLSGVVLDIREFIELIRPFIIQKLCQESIDIRDKPGRKILASERWIIARLIDNMIYCDILRYYRRDSRYENIYFYVQSQIPDLEIIFSRCLFNAIPIHRLPNKLDVLYSDRYLILRTLKREFWSDNLNYLRP